MKLKLPLVLLTALMPTALAAVPSPQDCRVFKETDAGSPAYILKSINSRVVYAGDTLPDNTAGEICGHVKEGECQAGAFFQTTAPGYDPQISSSTLTATQGSIIIQNGVLLNNAKLHTLTNYATDETWGLAQIVICHSTFSNTCELKSNYCTIEYWQIGDNTNDTVITLTSSGGTFKEGTVKAAATIRAAGTVKFDGLVLNEALDIQRIPGDESQAPGANSGFVDIRNWELSGSGMMMLSNCGGTLANGTVHGEKTITADAAVTLDDLILDAEEDVLHVIGKDDIVITTKGDTSFASEEGDGAGKLLLETSGKVTIGENPGAGEEIHTLKGNVEVKFLERGQSGEDEYDLNVYCKMDGSLKVIAAGKLNTGILLGTADIQAKRVYLTAFQGGPLDIKVEKSVTVTGNVDADSVCISQTGEKALEEYVGITFRGSLVGGDKIELKGQSVTGTEKDSLVSSNDCDIEALGDIDIKGKLQVGDNASIRAGGSMYFGGAEALEDSLPESRLVFNAGTTMQFGGDVKLDFASFNAGSDMTFGGRVDLQDAAIETEGQVTFSKGGTLADTTVSAPKVTIEQGLSASTFLLTGGNNGKDSSQVSFRGALELALDSRIVGDVVGDENPLYPHNVALDHSTVTGKVAKVDELKLVDATIGSAEEVDTLSSEGTSLISNQGDTLKVGSLNLEGGSLTVGPRLMPYEDKDVEVVEKLTVDASTVLNANLRLDNGACVAFATDAVVTLDGYGTITLMGDVDIVLLGGQGVPPAYSRLMMDCVEDVRDAGGRSVTGIWKRYSDREVWYTELYELSNQDGLHFTTNPDAAGATLSQLSLIYDTSMAQSRNSATGRLLIGYVPEPAAGALGLLALAALAARRRRR